jgi:3-phosphoshikimate 1-carboxyvinyltransferase
MKKKVLRGSLTVPGDKSISHRALIFSAIVEGTVEIENCSPAEDCVSSADCLRSLGLEISKASPLMEAKSPGLFALKEPTSQLFAGNSGTTIRLMSGLVAAQPFASVFDGDDSLRKRPMRRVLDPLAQMGASFKFLANGHSGEAKDGCAPFQIDGKPLSGKTFQLKVASAQVQTALLLAGLQAEERTTVVLPGTVRDHTARMFRLLDVPFESPDDLTVSVRKLNKKVAGKRIQVPADISSAAFMLVAAAIAPGSEVVLNNVGINAGRTLIIDVLKQMGADITLENKRDLGYEPVADIRIRGQGRLRGTTISGDTIASGIDEIPIIALAGAFCEGELVVSGAEELRFKESDRLAAIIDNLASAGAKIVGRQDGFVITGQPTLKGGSRWLTHDDHRLAMTGLVANLVCEEPLDLEEKDSVKISYPTFEQDLAILT